MVRLGSVNSKQNRSLMLNCMFINYPICDSQDRRSPFLYMRERKPRPGFRAGAKVDKSYTVQCESLSVVTLHSRFSCRCKSYIRLSVSISLVCTLIKSSVGDKSPSLDEPGYHRVTLILTPGHDRPVIGGRQGRPFRANKEERR